MSQMNDDPTLLKIRGESGFGKTDAEREQSRKDYIKKLSGAILTVVSKHGSAKLKAVGAPSVSNAVKASIIARGEASKKGLDLVVEPSFDNASFEGSTKTAIVLRVVSR